MPTESVGALRGIRPRQGSRRGTGRKPGRRMERESHMARPNNITQVTERHNVIAAVEMDQIMTKPGLLKAYTALVEAAEKLGGGGFKRYGNTVEVKIIKNGEQLADQLASDQASWDYKMESYQKAARGEFIESYRRSGIKEFASDEGLELPEFVEEENVNV